MLARGPWKQLSRIYFGNYLDSIDSKAARHISKAMWRSVDSLNLSIAIAAEVENQIDDRGCKYLTKSNMNKLTYLSLCTVFES